MKKVLPLMMIATGLLLASCNLANAPKAETMVSGTVVEPAQSTTPLTLTTKSWTGGAGTVNGTLYSPTAASKVAVSAVMSADGKFSLTLPTTVEDAYLLSSEVDSSAPVVGIPTGLTCTGDLKFSNTSARTASLSFRVDASKDGPITPTTMTGTMDEAAQTGSMNAKSGMLVYADRAVSLKGTQTCQGTQNGVTIKSDAKMDVNLAQGWNKVTLGVSSTFTATTQTSSVTMTSGALPTSNWVFQGATTTQSVVGKNASLPQLNLFR